MTTDSEWCSIRRRPATRGPTPTARSATARSRPSPGRGLRLRRPCDQVRRGLLVTAGERSFEAAGAMRGADLHQFVQVKLAQRADDRLVLGADPLLRLGL